ncbi:MAG: hypothetical protein A2W86_11755 [Bacteroidetes bacterium GWD2_45_23]|nr:MAG: hypothetical protein A2W87_08260 [Bacteroidetes bacterium GWC2_46_850]OFX70117.1 MAG: hypothetical protein A2071_04530 [Bacteroidetes bacterium GWC1_47_7]OFX85496.1 MAG: hypothetical protein A2W86_11755 [Bacteroidetes bacterium GWD2_45_23]HBB00720.1 hypothetical protein [Porphyromonadaceae bacterium]HCC19345.1 hypothetical protein [Porphyromonadaceae bacterium]
MKKISFDFKTNLPGLSMVYAIPPSSLKRVRRDYTHENFFLELVNLEQIIEFYFTDDTAQFKQVGENNGYKTELILVAPKDQPVNRNIFRELLAGYWFVLFVDQNNYIRLIGTEENQLRFSLEASTSGRNQVNCSFAGYQDEQALFIENSGINIL